MLQYITYLIVGVAFYLVAAVSAALGGPVYLSFLSFVLASILLFGVAAPLSLFRPRLAAYIALVCSTPVVVAILIAGGFEWHHITIAFLALAGVAVSLMTIVRTSPPFMNRVQAKTARVAVLGATILPAVIAIVLFVSIVTSLIGKPIVIR